MLSLSPSSSVDLRPPLIPSAFSPPFLFHVCRTYGSCYLPIAPFSHLYSPENSLFPFFLLQSALFLCGPCSNKYLFQFSRPLFLSSDLDRSCSLGSVLSQFLSLVQSHFSVHPGNTPPSLFFSTVQLGARFFLISFLGDGRLRPLLPSSLSVLCSFSFFSSPPVPLVMLLS